jgi:hypothetical protein
MIAKASFMGKDPNRIGVSILHDHDFCHGRISRRAGDAQSDGVSGSVRSPMSLLDELNRAAGRGRGGHALVPGEQGRSAHLSQRDVRGIVT